MSFAVDTTGSTSAAGAMQRASLVLGVAFLGGLLANSGTASGYELPAVRHGTMANPPGWVSRPREQELHAAGEAILEIRRLSGLTWEELASILRVSRRSLHLWASGKPIGAENDHRLQRLLAMLFRIDRGEAARNRALLLEARPDGTRLFDLLVAGRFEEAAGIAGPGQGRSRIARTSLSLVAREARQPRRPAELVGALQNRIHELDGRFVKGKSVPPPRSRKA